MYLKLTDLDGKAGEERLLAFRCRLDGGGGGRGEEFGDVLSNTLLQPL